MNYLSKYCPKQKYCREGTHVVCMYYRHNQEFGPRCGNPINVELTPTMIQHILANVNDIRGKVASGMETGKDGELLPRAYGLKKLEWDKELAILAQVLANQCLGGKEDVCRATNRFPKPSQTIVVIRYKYPNWDYMRSNSNDTRKGLNEEKLIFAMAKFLKTTYAYKRIVTRDMIVNCPHSYELPDINLKYYLNLIRGGATHIGCGVSAYSDNNMYMKSGSFMNCVEVVCNISESPRPGLPVYKITPPTPGRSYSKRCGCPRGYKETRSCLCERDRKLWKGNSIQAVYKKKDKVNSRSSLWPRRHQHKNRREENLEHESNRNVEKEIYNGERDDELMLPVQSILSTIHGSPVIRDGQVNGFESPRMVPKSRNHIDFKANDNEYNQSEENIVRSINYDTELSKLAKAITPKKNNKYSKFTNERNQPVRKFSRNPMTCGHQDRKPVSKPENSVKSIGDLIFRVREYVKEEPTTRSTLDVVEQNVFNHYQNIKPNNDVNIEKVKAQTIGYNNYRDYNDKRLLSILNTLEQEVNNIIFDENMKNLFYSKMKKIYETGLKKHGETPSFSALKQPEESPSLSELAKQLSIYKKDLNELRDYLKNVNRASVDDEIPKYGRMIHSLPKETKYENKITYIENENNQNEYNNYMDHEIKHFSNVPNSYIPRNTAVMELRNYNNIKYKDISNDNIDRQNEDYNELQDNIERIHQETFPPAYDDVRASIFSKVIEYNSLENFDDVNVGLEQSFINDEINNETNDINRRSTSTFLESETQFNYPYNRMKQVEATHLKIDSPWQTIYSSESEIQI